MLTGQQAPVTRGADLYNFYDIAYIDGDGVERIERWDFDYFEIASSGALLIFKDNELLAAFGRFDKVWKVECSDD